MKKNSSFKTKYNLIKRQLQSGEEQITNLSKEQKELLLELLKRDMIKKEQKLINLNDDIKQLKNDKTKR